MSSLCEEHRHCHSHSFYSAKEITLPPRKLLNRSKESPSSINVGSHEDYEEEADPYSSDEFRMYEFKIRRCMRSRSHDWTDCPFAHPGEKARRRDPRRFHYSGNPCADFRHGTCPRGDSCEFAHGVFECWLHPARYRTHACKDGKNCTRKVCFFAHTPRQLRVLPLSSQSHCSSPSGSISSGPCSYCQSIASSPTSTLLGLSHLSPPLSPKLSPPISPSTNKDGLRGYSLFSRFNEAALPLSPNAAKRLSLSEYLSYKSALMELVSSLENMELVSSLETSMELASSLDCDDQQTQFFLSPTTSGGSKDLFNEQDGLGCNGGPDLGWVNELVM